MKRILLAAAAAACAFGIVFSVLCMAAPLLRAPDASAAQEVYYLRDSGGRVAVYASAAGGQPLAVYDIYVNLLPQSDALRLKAGIPVAGEAALERMLEDLGA